MAAFMPPWQNWDAVTEILWPIQSRSVSGPLEENFITLCSRLIWAKFTEKEGFFMQRQVCNFIHFDHLSKIKPPKRYKNFDERKTSWWNDCFMKSEINFWSETIYLQTNLLLTFQTQSNITEMCFKISHLKNARLKQM